MKANELKHLEDQQAALIILNGSLETVGGINANGGYCDCCGENGEFELVKVINMETMEDDTASFLAKVKEANR